MGLCDSTRCWRWQHGSAAAFKAGVAALLLGLTLAQTAPPQTKCPAVAAQSNLTEAQYHNITDEDYSGFLSAFVQSFLNTVQPNPFPKEIVVRMIKDLNQVLSNQDLIKDALEYQVGFLVCAAIGVLYIVLMPIVGLFLACCRCCGNCGGKMYQKQTSSVHCHRRALFWSAFVTTAIILAGNICMFKSNEALKVTIDQTADGLSRTFDNINTFLSAVPEEMSHVVNESYKTIQEVTRNLETIGPQLGAQIQEAFRDTIKPALNSVRLLDEDTENTSDQLNKLNSSLAELQSSVDRLQANVTAVKDHINQTLSNPDCTGCDKLLPELKELDTLDTTIIIPSAKELQFAVDEVMKINLSSKVKEVEDYFNSIPQRVTNDTEGIVQSSRKLLDDIRAQIVKIADIPLATLDNITDTLDEARREIARIIPQLERGERIRWGVCVALCCLVLLVVACYFMGMILGPLGLKPNADPRKRSCTADSGGTFLMMGAGFSFLFSWLFMILVLVLFLLGGNIYTLVCRPWDNGQLLKLLDTPGLIPGFDSIGPSLGLKSRVNISDIYKACERDEPLWTTLHLDEVIDLDDTLNVSKYTDQILNYFDDVDITLSTLTLLSPDIKDQLSSFSGEADDFDAVDITPQINNVSRINLNTTADKLDQLASLQTNNNTKKELQDQARELRQIQAAIETALIPQMENINTSVAGLRFIAQKINGTVGEVLSNVGAAQDFLNTNTTQIVKTESKEFVDCQMGYFFVYADWAKLTITVHIGRCGPVADVVDFFESLICLNLVESLNAFWFSLGWCMIFFVPGIIFSIKLAKYYRKMKYSDVFEENLTMSHIPRAHVKIS
ncbi:prominin-2 isoform X1 [Xyrichtys novacula]|uniref:Prominin-2 isoform X1 n=1 Tax=Xyrichtys novacula TaxID=13765 RepID=A0AAV1G4X8_XYRNO|nr:prominin-2 isoform X1 [Xyrichtys novacula]